MDEHSPRDRREGPAGPAAPLTSSDTDPQSPRHRFRAFLAERMGGVSEAAWYFDQVMPKLGDDPEARVAAEELLDHLGRLMQFGARRPPESALSLWTSRQGACVAVALVDAFDAVNHIGRALRALEDLRVSEAHERGAPLGLLCVVAGEIRRRPIEQLLEVRRVAQHLRIVGLPSLVSVARAVEAGTLTPEAVSALLEPGVFVDGIVSQLIRENGAPGATGA